MKAYSFLLVYIMATHYSLVHAMEGQSPHRFTTKKLIKEDGSSCYLECTSVSSSKKIFRLCDQQKVAHLFATIIPYEANEYVQLTVSSGQAQSVFDHLTPNNNEDILTQLEIAEELNNSPYLIKKDLFACNNNNVSHIRFSYLDKANNLYSNELGLEETRSEELWILFHTALQLCFALKDNKPTQVSALLQNPSIKKLCAEMESVARLVARYHSQLPL